MNVREASAGDRESIHTIARRSLEETYTDFLDESTIDAATTNWYGAEGEIHELLEDDEHLVLVVDRNGEVIAFSESRLLGDNHATGRINWIHVDPDNRGEGLGARLLARTREALFEAGADQLQGAVLAGNEFGNEFYRAHGFERVDARELAVGDETHTENVYVEADGDVDDDWRAQATVEEDGLTCHVSYGEPARGSKAPFYAAYADVDATDRYGWYCGNCDSLDNAMDSMGRIQCNDCGNRRKATRWDAAYL